MQPLNPTTLSSALLTTIDQAVAGAGVPESRMVQAISELSRLYTRGRVDLPPQYLSDRAYATAYMSYFLPVNLAKIQILLNEMPDLNEGGTLRVLDVGSGPGTGALAVLDWWHRRMDTAATSLSVIAVDHVKEALHRGAELWRTYCQEAHIQASLQTIEGNMNKGLSGSWAESVRATAPFDVVILANCLNELFVDERDPITSRAALVTALLDCLAPAGTLMIVEPALRDTSRALHQVRDRLLQEQRCAVYSPCLHERPCPALINPYDWCHEERAWKTPATIQAIDEQIGFIKDALKFSYLLLRKDGVTIAPRDANVFRMVSELRKMKGDTRAWMCNEVGRSELGRLDRAMSENNGQWDNCQRGMIVKVEGLKRKDGATLARIPVEGTVRIVRPV